VNALEVQRWLPLLAEWTERWHSDNGDGDTGTEAMEFVRLLGHLHLNNFRLWHQEDVARRTDIEPSEIARVKRAVDKLNQQRNDAIEQIDEWLLATRYGHLGADLPLRTETPGAAMDRLSVLALKVFHMQEQTERKDAGVAHVDACAGKLTVLLAQRTDLARALEEMLGDLERGLIRMRVYRQFKMYNDPTLNPQLYQRRG
jgi:hypothetical protein